MFHPGGGDLGSLSLLQPPSKLRERVQTIWPVTRFAETCQVLESGKPVYIGYSWAPPDDDPDAPYGSLLQIAVTTAERPWGDYRRPLPSSASSSAMSSCTRSAISSRIAATCVGERPFGSCRSQSM